VPGVRRTYTGPRKWENPEVAPFSEVADCSRGDIRLAAEVALAELRGMHVPSFANERALETLRTLAR
jgi:hypothetical protein